MTTGRTSCPTSTSHHRRRCRSTTPHRETACRACTPRGSRAVHPLAQRPWWIRSLGSFWLVATLTATLGFGFHYGVDLIAGAVLCLTLDAALRDPERGWGWFRVRLLIGGSALLAGLLLSYRFAAVQMAEYPAIFGPLLMAVLVLMSVAYFATFFARPRHCSCGVGRARRRVGCRYSRESGSSSSLIFMRSSSSRCSR